LPPYGGERSAHVWRESAATTVKDMNALSVSAPPLSSGLQQAFLTNLNGETVSTDAPFLAQ
jgi:hypothetical protein